eukprot:m.16741 g.16741  ORF g.16741 m.16741 type:complete len:64 (+) comp7215_c0_seq2:1191-1382(+)
MMQDANIHMILLDEMERTLLILFPPSLLPIIHTHVNINTPTATPTPINAERLGYTRAACFLFP